MPIGRPDRRFLCGYRKWTRSGINRFTAHAHSSAAVAWGRSGEALRCTRDGAEGDLSDATLLWARTAEDIKIAIGSAYPLDEEVSTFFRGRDLLTGLPRSIEVTSAQIREAIDPSVEQIVGAVKDTIEETPPELVADIMDQGIYLAGGGALLRGMDTRISEATQMAVHIADDPLTCVARGCGKILEELENYERSLVMETYAALPR